MIETADSIDQTRRRLGQFHGASPGPLLICVGGLHGNEPAGVRALQQVLERLRDLAPAGRGDFVALAGNLEALALGRRYVERDLNRHWLPERVAALRRGDADYSSAEDRQQTELLVTIEELLHGRRGPAIFVDLHTSSGEGPPFAIIADTLSHRRLASRLPLPVVLGLEEKVEGTIVDYIHHLGHIGVSFEGGPHGDPATEEHLRSIIILTLVAAGILERSDLPDYRAHRDRLARATSHLPRFMELRSRHAVSKEDGFIMEPGLASFAPVGRDQILAHDHQGPVRAAEEGRVLLPLYQPQGTDGYFLVRTIGRFRLWAAATLRHLRAHRLLPLLPTIHPHAGDPDSLIIDSPEPSPRLTELLHLLGYRRERRANNQRIVSRHPQNAPPPNNH